MIHAAPPGTIDCSINALMGRHNGTYGAADWVVWITSAAFPRFWSHEAMKTARPLPDDFHGRPFTVVEAAAAGVSPKRLRHRSLVSARAGDSLPGPDAGASAERESAAFH